MPEHAEPNPLQHYLDAARAEVRALKQQLDWFKRQLFDRKSERVLPDPAIQPNLLAAAGVTVDTPPATEGTPVSYVRRPKQRGDDCVSDTGLRFDDSVPRQTIRLP